MAIRGSFNPSEWLRGSRFAGVEMVDNPNFPKDSIKTRKIAVLIADGFDDARSSK